MAPHRCVSQAFRRRFAVFRGCFADVSRMFRGTFRTFRSCFADVSQKFAALTRRESV